MDFKAVLRDLFVALMAGSRPAWTTLLLSVVVGALLWSAVGVVHAQLNPACLGRLIAMACASPLSPAALRTHTRRVWVA